MHLKKDVDFEHPAKGDDRCRDCKHYRGAKLAKCTVVMGKIEPQDWCKLFVRRVRQPANRAA